MQARLACVSQAHYGNSASCPAERSIPKHSRQAQLVRWCCTVQAMLKTNMGTSKLWASRRCGELGQGTERHLDALGLPHSSPCSSRVWGGERVPKLSAMCCGNAYYHNRQAMLYFDGLASTRCHALGGMVRRAALAACPVFRWRSGGGVRSGLPLRPWGCCPWHYIRKPPDDFPDQFPKKLKIFLIKYIF